MLKSKTKRCPECRYNLVPIPKELKKEEWVCTRNIASVESGDFIWCGLPAKFTCPNWNVPKYLCSTGMCGKHGEVTKKKKHVEKRKVRKA